MILNDWSINQKCFLYILSVNLKSVRASLLQWIASFIQAPAVVNCAKEQKNAFKVTNALVAVPNPSNIILSQRDVTTSVIIKGI